MKEIYKNDYGISYLVDNHLNPKYELQLVVNNLGIFMSVEEMNNLLEIVRSSYDVINNNCNCEKCKANNSSSLWKINNFFEVRLKIDNTVLNLLEDLIEGTRFILNIDAVLEQHRLR